MMTPRRDFGPTDIARQNADVWITAGRWLVRLMLPIALISFAVGNAVGLHNRVVVTPSLWFHHLGAGYATVSLRHGIVWLTVAFLGTMLESLVLHLDAFARGEPAAVTAAVLATLSRVFLRNWRIELLAPNVPMPSRACCSDRDPDSGILHQLCSALSVAPMAPPSRLTLSSDPRGPFAQSGHRAEVLVAA
jgi:hypothetical protein